MQQHYGEISKQDRKDWNRHVRERSIRRSEGGNNLGVVAGMIVMMAFASASIGLTTLAGWLFVVSIGFAFISWVMRKLYGQSKQQGH